MYPSHLAAPEFEPFRPRFPWRGRDAQTLRNFLAGPRPSPRDRSDERLTFIMPDSGGANGGGDGEGDRLTGALSSPTDRRADRPLIILIHGLSGCEESAYMLESTQYFRAIGYPVLRLNLRGSVPTQPHCREHYHAGRDEDLAAVLDQLDGRPEVAEGVILIGFSLGGGMLLKFLALRGRGYPVRAAVTVSAPIDLAATAERFLQPRNRAYHAWILRHMKRDALAARDIEARLARAVRTARTIFEFDDRVVAPCNGFDGARDYYNQCSAAQFLGEIKVPTLVIHALDDPWIPARGYLGVDWDKNGSVTALLTERGGHVGFHDGRGTWHNRMAGLFLQQIGF